MSRARAIWLVARRELVERGRSRGFVLSIILTQVLIVGAIIVPRLLAGDQSVGLGVVGSPPASLEPALTRAAEVYGVRLRLSSYADRAAAEAALAAKSIDAALIIGANPTDAGAIVVRDTLDDRLRAIVGSVVLGVRQQELLESAGLSADQVAQILGASPPVVIAIDPPDPERESAFLLANIGVIILFVSIFTFGLYVLTGVVEEKQSRVVEVILATVDPRDLLVGKVLGIGILGLVQLGVFLVTGLVVAGFFGQFTLPPTTLGTAFQVVLWFVLGYTFYATAYGAIGALATRMEEASNASSPLAILASLGYFVALVVVNDDPEGLVATVATFIPPIAPMIVPMRAALDAIPWWEVVLSAGLMLVSIYALFVFGGRVYRGAVLQTAGRMRIRDAWRAAND